MLISFQETMNCDSAQLLLYKAMFFIFAMMCNNNLRLHDE